MASTPKLKVPKYEGYRATAAKRLQKPEYKPDEEDPIDMSEEDDEEDKNESEG